MSKEEILKVQTCVLKVNIHCDGCKQKVKKILQRIEGVFTTHIDAEHGKVTVSGNVEPSVLIKKLAKSGKHAELWGAKKPNNNGHHENHLANQLKNMQIDNAKGGGGHNNNNNKGGQKGNNNQQHQPKGGQQPQHPQLTPQQLQQLQQQMKSFQDLGLPLPQQLKMPNQPQQQQQNQKTVKFALPPEDEYLGDEYADDDEFDDEDFDSDGEFDDEIMDGPPYAGNKMKPMMGNVPQGLGNMMMNGMNPAQFMNAQKGAPIGGANGKRGGPGNEALPLHINMGGDAEGKNGNGGKKGGGGGNQNQGGKNGGGKGQNGNNGGGGGNNNKNGNGGEGNGNNMQVNGGKKGNNGGGGTNDGFLVGGPHGNMGQLGNLNLPMGQMGNLPLGPMGNIPAVPGLPATATMGGAGARGSYGNFHGAGPDLMPGNPYQQQQQQQQPYLAAVMNQQQRAMGNERFQPMMYARPPPAVNYVPQHPYPPYPYPYPYPYPPQHGPDPYTSFFSDENTSSCNVM